MATSTSAALRQFASSACAAALCLLASAAHAGPTLDGVRARDAVRCGTSSGILGFSALNSASGRWEGLDVDVCRAVAAAVLGSGDKVEFVPLRLEERIPMLSAGRIDILSYNTAFTMARDATMGIKATVVTYYDGQGFLVPVASKIRSTRQLVNRRICVTTTGSSEQTLAEYVAANRTGMTVLKFARFGDAADAYLAGLCTALSADATSLALVRRVRTAATQGHAILPELISKEPLGPLIRRGDDAWDSIVKWVVRGLIAAEEHGVTQANAQQQADSSTNSEVRRMLGQSADTGKLIGLDRAWLLRAIQATGNYGEIFARNVGPDSALGLPRGLNAQWLHGGLQYALPIR
ncbi:MAG: transporter substrate-binding domain-containing protein [Pseudorhodoferax sp.]